MPPALNLVGSPPFGRLTVVALATSKGGRRVWTCQCECGRTRDVPAGNLRQGTVTQCRVCAAAAKGGSDDLTGQRYGKLVAERLTARQNGKRAWRCRCDCGRYRSVEAWRLTGLRCDACRHCYAVEQIRARLEALEEGPPPPPEGRDREIFDLRRQGWSLPRIGERFGLSKQRIAQILQRG